MRVLIIGGTSEGSQLARLLDGQRDFSPILSLAGRTKDPKIPITKTRIGGFGGVEGLCDYLRRETIHCVVDASHPFAAQMSHNVAEATRQAEIPLLGLRRPAWQPQPGDSWTEVVDMPSAVTALQTLVRGGQAPRVFLAIGRLEIEEFQRVPEPYYLLRTIDPPQKEPAFANFHLIQDRPPFDLPSEKALLEMHRIDVVVTKNSGSDATYAKVVAARELGLPMIVVMQPKPPTSEHVQTVEEAYAWLSQHV